MSIVPFILVLLAGAPTSQPAIGPVTSLVPVEPFAKGTPERAYVEFYNAVREGRVEEALALAQPVDENLKPMVVAQFRVLNAIEAFKDAAVAKFGADAIENLQNSGMIDPATAATAKAVIEGATAKIWLTAPDTNRRESTEISLKAVDGKWRVFALDAGGTGIRDSDVTDVWDMNELPGAVVAIEKGVAAVDAARARINRGEIAAEEVTRAFFDAAMLAMPGSGASPAANGAK